MILDRLGTDSVIRQVSNIKSEELGVRQYRWVISWVKAGGSQGHKGSDIAIVSCRYSCGILLPQQQCYVAIAVVFVAVMLKKVDGPGRTGDRHGHL